MLVLYIEDYREIRAQLFSQAISEFQKDFKVIYENDYCKAFDIVCKRKIDVIFMNIDNMDRCVEFFDSIKTFREKVQKYRKEIIFIGITENKNDCYKAINIDFNGALLLPFNQERFNECILKLKEKILKHDVFIQTMPNFNLFIDGKTVFLKNSKSKEILAYLVNKKGDSVTNKDLISEIWPSKLLDEKALNCCRVAVHNLKKFLNDNGILYILHSSGRERCVNRDDFGCDLYKLYDNDMQYISKYDGRYLEEYSWAEPTKGSINRHLTMHNFDVPY